MQIVHSSEEWESLSTGMSHGLQMRHGLGESLQQGVAAPSKSTRVSFAHSLVPQDKPTQGGDVYGWHDGMRLSSPSPYLAAFCIVMSPWVANA